MTILFETARLFGRESPLYFSQDQPTRMVLWRMISSR